MRRPDYSSTRPAMELSPPPPGSTPGARSGPEAQIKAALTMLSKNIGKVVDGGHAAAALARCSEIRAIVIDGTYCPTSMTGHPSGCKCR